MEVTEADAEPDADQEEADQMRDTSPNQDVTQNSTPPGKITHYQLTGRL